MGEDGDKWGHKKEETEGEGACQLTCSPLLKPAASQAGSTALSRDARVFVSLVEVVLFSLVRGRVEEEHKPVGHGIRVHCTSR